MAHVDAKQLNSEGIRALNARDFSAASTLFQRAAAIDPAPQLYLNIAFAARSLGDIAGEQQALDQALALDPYFQLALFQRADWLARHGGRSAAAAAFGQFLATLGAHSGLTPQLQNAAAHARCFVDEDRAALAATVERALGNPDALSPRVAETMAIVLGKADVYRSQPTGLYIPFLPELPFFERSLFPWFAELEAATDRITAELLAILTDDERLEPYVAFGPTQPVNQWAALNHSRNWSAFFLYRNGVPDRANCARCPETAALLARLPLLDIRGRGPTAMFSILRPGTRIPPHTGATNSRAVVHLPLIIPPDCGFRVGSTVREWRPGSAWAFDDTIEHEAWNNSDRARAILICDAWNPYLDRGERDQITRLLSAIEQHAGREEWTA